jgi:hypothetical protein
MYTVFAELPGGSGALFANLVNGAILLTVRAFNFLVVAHTFRPPFCAASYLRPLNSHAISSPSPPSA